ncbi:hypothetical protein MNBD_CHLOROFLEXI01-5049 [hydrothermal vent metagenome]|uniref:Uncharacterized protein n=1 Tax=hydrothermal vent metagenome TaxID=652676 RepID=A0A3B0V8I8_9ZZZZ
MLPDSIQSLIIFFMLATPAFIALWLYKQRYPIQYHQIAPSQLEQASLYISLSIIINLAVFIIFLIPILLISYYYFPNFKLSQFPGDIFQTAQFFKVSLHILLYISLSLGIILWIDKYLIPKLPEPSLPLWYDELIRLIARQEHEKTLYRIFAQLENGDYCSGYIKRITWVGNEANTIELTFIDYYYKQKDGTNLTKSDRMLLSSDDIVALGLYSII